MSIHNGSEDVTVNVAILGLGRIAERMAATLAGMRNDVRYSKAVSLYAAATRDDRQRAQRFGHTMSCSTLRLWIWYILLRLTHSMQNRLLHVWSTARTYSLRNLLPQQKSRPGK